MVGKALSSVVDEDHWERPLEIYSPTRGLPRNYRIYHTIHDLKTVVLRFANLFGPYGKGFQNSVFYQLLHPPGLEQRRDQDLRSGDQSRNVMFCRRRHRDPLAGGPESAALSVRPISQPETSTGPSAKLPRPSLRSWAGGNSPTSPGRTSARGSRSKMSDSPSTTSGADRMASAFFSGGRPAVTRTTLESARRGIT